MAENTAMRNNALPYPVYAVPYTIVVPLLDADGDPIAGAAGLDSEISLNGDTPADGGTEAEVGNGNYSIVFTAANMTADIVSGTLKSSTAGIKDTPFVLYPRKLVPVLSGTVAGGAAGTITLPAAAGALDDRWNGCLCVATIDGNVEARIIDDYVGLTKVASVTPDWNVTPDSDDTFVIYLPEGSQLPTAESTSLADETRSANLLDQLKTLITVVESQRGHHTHQPSTGGIFFIAPNTGDTHANGARGGISDPYSSWQDAHDNAGSDHGHDLYILVADDTDSATTMAEDIAPTNGYSLTRGPGRDFILTPTANNTVAITVTNTDGCMFSGFQLDDFDGTGAQNGVEVSGSDFFHSDRIWYNDTRGDAIELTDCDNFVITNNVLQGSGAGAGHGIQVIAGAGQTGNYGLICHNLINDVQGDGVQIDTTGGGTVDAARICDNLIQGSTDDGIDIVDSGCIDTIISGNVLGNNSGNNIEDAGTNTILANNEQWAKAGSTRDDLDDDFTTAQKASINAEVDGAFNTAIPGSPTADSINQRMEAVDVLTEATGGGDLAAIKAITDALTAAAAAKLATSAGTIVTGTVDTVTNSHTPTATEFQADDITEATADHFNGRIVIFTSGALQNQATDITDYEAVGGIGQFTVTALSEAPANDDTFIIV